MDKSRKLEIRYLDENFKLKNITITGINTEITQEQAKTFGIKLTEFISNASYDSTSIIDTTKII